MDNTHQFFRFLASYKQRLSWDDYFSSIACITSNRSSCDRLKVGCVIINQDNRILSTGYNGYIAGMPHNISNIRNNHEIMTVHAEQNSICYASKNGVSISNCKIYITHFPCINCTKLLISSGISEIYYINDYNNDEMVYKLATLSNIKIIKL